MVVPPLIFLLQSHLAYARCFAFRVFGIAVKWVEKSKIFRDKDLFIRAKNGFC